MSEIRLVFAGDVSPNAAREVIAFAHSKGFALRAQYDGQLQSRPNWSPEEINQLDLADVLLPTQYRRYEGEPQWHIEQRKRLVRPIYVLGGTTVGELTRRSFAEFIEKRTEEGMSWDHKARILSFMLERQLRFSDVDPAEILKTPIESESLGLTRRTYNMLAREGLKWLELLQYITKGELRDIRNLGEKTEAEVGGVLRRHGIWFRGK